MVLVYGLLTYYAVGAVFCLAMLPFVLLWVIGGAVRGWLAKSEPEHVVRVYPIVFEGGEKPHRCLGPVKMVVDCPAGADKEDLFYASQRAEFDDSYCASI